MENQNYLGIYMGRTAATAVCFSLQGARRSISGCFKVFIEQAGQENAPRVLADLIARGCAERNWTQ